jgi:fructose-1,6-bisphosphatase
MGSKRKIESINEIKSWFFEKINKIIKLLRKHIKKRARPKLRKIYRQVFLEYLGSFVVSYIL